MSDNSRKVYVCCKCGSTEVQHAMWVELNTDTVRDPFGTWCYVDEAVRRGHTSGNSWCNGCDKHTRIELQSASADEIECGCPHGVVAPLHCDDCDRGVV
jgi:hypothetical protein